MTELPEPQGVQPVLNAIDQLHGELASYPQGNEQFESVRAHLESVLESVKQTLIDECEQYDSSLTYRTWKMESIE